MKKSANVIPASDATFDEVVLRSDKPVLVELGSTWCGPCKALGPIVSQIADENADRYRVVYVDVDESPEVAKRYKVRGVPTTLAFSNGETKGQILGLTTKAKLLALLT